VNAGRGASSSAIRDERKIYNYLAKYWELLDMWALDCYTMVLHLKWVVWERSASQKRL
jgi:hypothetical protein